MTSLLKSNKSSISLFYIRDYYTNLYQKLQASTLILQKIKYRYYESIT